MSCEHCGGDHEQSVQIPAMRTFRVLLEKGANSQEYIDAHSLTCEGDVAKFYIYRADGPGGQLMGYCSRVVRPYLDIEDITTILTATATSIN